MKKDKGKDGWRLKIDLKTYAYSRSVFIEQEQLTEEEFKEGLYNADKTIQIFISHYVASLRLFPFR